MADVLSLEVLEGQYPLGSLPTDLGSLGPWLQSSCVLGTWANHKKDFGPDQRPRQSCSAVLTGSCCLAEGRLKERLTFQGCICAGTEGKWDKPAHLASVKFPSGAHYKALLLQGKSRDHILDLGEHPTSSAYVHALDILQFLEHGQPHYICVTHMPNKQAWRQGTLFTRVGSGYMRNIKGSS